MPETETNGWIFGCITEFLEEGGCNNGDGYVQAPDGSRAGLIWDVGNSKLGVVNKPDESRWGIFQVYFPKVVYTTSDLVEGFRKVLPEIIHEYEKLKQAVS